ncbi:MAG TPA: heparan-alpha-glucosaminide N-acetyltransferase domain-containing protein [Hanamia sp.]|nr:heparan-alpha-glucosaminide N-acetyltransferase domain-containing protein [Hanamia sp.]
MENINLVAAVSDTAAAEPTVNNKGLISNRRIESIDILRGIVMVIMALDHARDYFHFADAPLNLSRTTTILFFTRWITHYCAPIFVFLSGTSIFLQGLRKSKKVLQSFLVKRGLWLIFVETVIVSFAWTFNPNYNLIIFQVIWAIGISMLLLGLLIRLPFNFILALGLIIVLGHNLLDFPEAAPKFKAGFWWDLFHHGFFAAYPINQNHFLVILYPFVPWTGLMMLGYCSGVFFSSKFTVERRRKILSRTGIGLILFFIVLRFLNFYGNPEPWSVQKNAWFTVLSFINVHKYPPSLLYMCMTIGPAFLLLAFFEKIKNGFTEVMRIYGRVPFFYYVIHLYLIHSISAIVYLANGHTFAEATTIGKNIPFYFLAANDGYSLFIVYIVWISVVIALYPLCKWFNNYKTNHREKWWLSYL